MGIKFNQIIVWLIVGALAGAFVGKLPTRRTKTWLARLKNLGIGLSGALLGGVLFTVFGIDLGLGKIAITLEDLLAAILGSVICLFTARLYRWYQDRHATTVDSGAAVAKDVPPDTN